MGMGTRAMARIGGGIAATALAAFVAAPAWAQDVLGQPTPGAIDLQPAASPLKHEAIFFHDVVLMPIITVITLLVLGLLIWIAIRYNKKANPVPAKWSHNTVIEVIWTVVPVLILVGISLFSFRLLFAYHDYPDSDVTVKITGNQWNWGYEYPDQGVAEYISNMLPEDKAPKHLYRLAADEPMVVPVGQNVRLLITASDVIHAVEDKHNGTGYSNVMYIGAAPDCAKNRAFLRKQRDAFESGRSSPDFVAEDYEVDFADRFLPSDLTPLGRRQMGYDS